MTTRRKAIIGSAVLVAALVAVLFTLLVRGTFTTEYHVQGFEVERECGLDLDMRSAERNLAKDSGHPKDVLVFEASNGQFAAHEGTASHERRIWCPGDWADAPGYAAFIYWDGERGTWATDEDYEKAWWDAGGGLGGGKDVPRPARGGSGG